MVGRLLGEPNGEDVVIGTGGACSVIVSQSLFKVIYIYIGNFVCIPWFSHSVHPQNYMACSLKLTSGLVAESLRSCALVARRKNPSPRPHDGRGFSLHVFACFPSFVHSSARTVQSLRREWRQPGLAGRGHHGGKRGRPVHASRCSECECRRVEGGEFRRHILVSSVYMPGRCVRCSTSSPQSN